MNKDVVSRLLRADDLAPLRYSESPKDALLTFTCESRGFVQNEIVPIASVPEILDITVLNQRTD